MSERQRSHLLLPAAAAIAAPLLYVLSVGPVVWLMSHGWLSPQNETVEVIYAPLEFLVQFEWFGALLEWYMNLWGD